MPLKTLLFLLGVFWSFSLFGQSPVETYDSTKAYSIGALVLVGEESYIATAESTGKNPPDNTDAWTNLSVAASALGTPVEQVPSLSTSEILSSLPVQRPKPIPLLPLLFRACLAGLCRHLPGSRRDDDNGFHE